MICLKKNSRYKYKKTCHPPIMKENSWKDIFEAMPFPCFILNKNPSGDLVIKEVNEAFTACSGIPREKLLGRTSAFFESSTEKEFFGRRFHAALEKVRSSGERRRIEMQVCEATNIRHDHSEKYFDIDLIPLKEDDKLTFIIVTFKEITVEKQLENELKISRQEYRNFMRQNPDGLYRLNLDGHFVHVNEGLAKLAEVSIEELIGQNFLPFCTSHHQQLVLDHFTEASEGKITSFEADFVSAKGKAYILKVLLMPMFLDNQVVEVHGIAKDVTAARQTEKIMVEKSRFLEVNASFITSLVENEINDEALQEAFGIIAQTVEADRMYYFGADKDPLTGEILISQKVEWCSKIASPQIDNPELQKMPIKKVEEITSPLTRNLPFTATLSNLEEGTLKEIFIDEHIKSMLLLPIFLEDQLFGFVGFDDCTTERIWKEEEISFLKSLTQNLTNAFEKRAALDTVKKREEELRKSEQKFRALVQEGSDLIGILDIDGYYSFVSENYKSILGLDPKEMTGKNAFHYIHPEDWERVKNQFNLLKENKQVQISPFRFRNKKCEWRWIQTTATNLLNDPAVNGIVANSLDITTIIEQAREIEHINERYQLAATATEDLIYDWDLKSNNVTRFHKGQKELFGYSLSELNKRDFWRKFIHPEDLPIEKKKLNLAIEDPEKNYIKTEYRFRRADGSYARVIDKGYILRDSKGTAVRLIGATRDISKITDRKEALKIANKRFKMAMKATNEMIWEWDIASDSVVRSKGYKKIFGYDTNEATSVHSFWVTKVTEEDQVRIKESLNKAIEDPKAKKWKLEYKIKKADGNIAFVIDRGYILRDDSGKAIRIVGAVLDVTNSRKLLTKVQKQNKVLKDIAWEQSHIVRAPLARFKGLVDLFEHQNFEEMDQQEILFHLKSSADELDCIIRRIVEKTEKIDVEFH